MGPLFSFGIISDCQFADVPNLMDGVSDRRYRDSLKKLTDSVEFFNKKDLAFIVHLGDLIDQGFENFDKVLEICKKSKTEIWQVLGNHDFYGNNYELVGNSEKIMKKLGLNTPYYSKDIDNYKFIILDTNEEGVIKTKINSSEYKKGNKLIEQYIKLGRVNAKPWNGQISANQYEWMMAEIDIAERMNQNVIIFSHHGLFPKNRENMLNDEQMLIELSKKKSVKVYINGHNHNGDYGQFRHLHCLTVKGMVDTGENAYAVASVFDDRIEIEGYGREPNRALKFDTFSRVIGSTTILKYKDKFVFQNRDKKPNISSPGLLSGFGGNAEPVDKNFLDNAKRELKEETDLPVDELTFQRLGILNDDDSNICELYLVEINDDHFKVFEGRGFKELSANEIRKMDKSKFSLTIKQAIENNILF